MRWFLTRSNVCFAEIESSWKVIVRTNTKTLVTIITKRNVMKNPRNAATINELKRDEDEYLTRQEKKPPQKRGFKRNTTALYVITMKCNEYKRSSTST